MSLPCGIFSSFGEQGYSWLQCMGFPLRSLLLLKHRFTRYATWASVVAAQGHSSCSSQDLGHRLSSCLGRGLVALWFVGSTQTRDQTCLLHCKADCLPLSHRGSLDGFLLKIIFKMSKRTYTFHNILYCQIVTFIILAI